MCGRIRTIIIIFILLSIVSFLLLTKFYSPLRRSLFGGEFLISFDDIQFWLKEVPQKNYYKVYAKYLKSPETVTEVGHGIYFTGRTEKDGGGWGIIFNPIDGKIYGKGRELPKAFFEARSIEEQKKLLSSPGERIFFYLGEGRLDDGVFKPSFSTGTKFSFYQSRPLEITDAPRDYIKIYSPGTLKKFTKDEVGIEE